MDKKSKTYKCGQDEREKPHTSATPLLDKILPVHSVGEWPEGLSLRREDMYDYRG